MQKNEQLHNIYKMYVPYIPRQPSKNYPRYVIEKRSGNGGYIKNMEKNYDYYHHAYKPINRINNGSIKYVPGKKLNPIKRNNIINIY